MQTDIAKRACRPVPDTGDATIERLQQAARLVALGRPKAEVAALLGCSRTTLWRMETRPGPFRARVAAERADLAARVRARFGAGGTAPGPLTAALARDIPRLLRLADRLGLGGRMPDGR